MCTILLMSNIFVTVIYMCLCVYMYVYIYIYISLMSNVFVAVICVCVCVCVCLCVLRDNKTAYLDEACDFLMDSRCSLVYSPEENLYFPLLNHFKIIVIVSVLKSSA